MKNLRKFNESVDVDRVRNIIEDFNENFLEFLDDGYSYRIAAYRIIRGKSSISSSFTFDNMDHYLQQRDDGHGPVVNFGPRSTWEGILFYMVTPFDFDVNVLCDNQTEEEKFDKNIAEVEKSISVYKKIKDEIKGNMDRFIDFYKMTPYGGLSISRYRRNEGSPYKLSFSFKIKF